MVGVGDAVRGMAMSPEIGVWRCWGRGGRARCSEAYDEISPSALQHFKHVIDNFGAFLDLLSDLKIRLLSKLMDYAKTGDDTVEFCRFYARWLASPLADWSKAEIHQLLGRCVNMAGWRMAYGKVGRRSMMDRKHRPFSLGRVLYHLVLGCVELGRLTGMWMGILDWFGEGVSSSIIGDWIGGAHTP